MNKVLSVLTWLIWVAASVIAIISSVKLPWFYMFCVDVTSVTTLMVMAVPIRDWFKSRKEKK